VLSKRQYDISRNPKKQPDAGLRFFLDRNLGSIQLSLQLRKAGVDVVVHDDVYEQTERDPWIFYRCGKQGLPVVTSDKDFMKSFPHMAAIALGNTTVIAFSNNNYNSDVRGRAFIKAKAKIERAIRKSKGVRFIGSVGTNGDFKVNERDPNPQRKTCDDRDWESYERVCKSEGVPYEKSTVAKSS
jgi:predicted nuclease of predicted toxin-antitoxin system